MQTVLIVDIAMMVIAGAIMIPVIVLSIETFSALLLSSNQHPPTNGPFTRGRVAVVVPAHNESNGISRTISDIRSQMRSGDTLVVVADNCADDTAEVARSAGAEVIERKDLSKVGKGFALDWGIRHLSSRPPETIIMIDADCRVAAGSIDRLAYTCAITGRPSQSYDLMIAPKHARVELRVAEFAWRVKNWIRPLGQLALGLPCQLMGTGMAFPWALISRMNLASAETVEDVKLGVDLTLAGHAPIFCPQALVTSEFPTHSDAAISQRERWEHGHLRMLLGAAPRLIWRGLKDRNPDVLATGLDLSVPPIILLMLLSASTTTITGILFTTVPGFSGVAFLLAGINLTLLTTTLALCWFTHGRDILPPSAFFALFAFVMQKTIIYGRIVIRKRPPGWVRTSRDK